MWKGKTLIPLNGADKADLVNGKVPASQLPSYVDDVVEYDSVEAFPETGEAGKIYVAMDTGYTYRWAGTDYIQIGGATLSEGDGIDIVNDLISIDMDYVESNLQGFEPTITDLATIRSGAAAGATAVQPADIVDGMEVVEYQGETPITEAQLAKAVAGKLAIYCNGRLYAKYYQSEAIINFHSFDIGHNISSSTTITSTMQSKEWVILLNRETRMLSNSGYMPVTAIGDYADNYFGATDAPSASGKKLVRELNLAKTQGMLAPEYDATAAYDVGDYCIYQNDLYRCTTAITVAEAWTAAHWTQVTVDNELQDLVVAAIPLEKIHALFAKLEKGKIISFDALGDGTQKRFRVIKLEANNVATLLSMDDINNQNYNSYPVADTFEDGNSYQRYATGALDRRLNTAYYDTLSADIKAAIVATSRIQSCYSIQVAGEGIFYINSNNSGMKYNYNRITQKTIGDRYCFALDVDDIIEYFDDAADNTINYTDLQEMFFGESSASFELAYVWLASASTTYHRNACIVDKAHGAISDFYADRTRIARPAFRIDLTNIDYTIE